MEESSDVPSSEKTLSTQKKLEDAMARFSAPSPKNLNAELERDKELDAHRAAIIALYDEGITPLKASVTEAILVEQFEKGAKLQLQIEEEKVKVCWRLMNGDPASISTYSGDLKKWPGVTLSEKGQVVRIDWSNQGLKGEVPPQFFDFESLASLELSGNKDLVWADPNPLKVSEQA